MIVDLLFDFIGGLFSGMGSNKNTGIGDKWYPKVGDDYVDNVPPR